MINLLCRLASGIDARSGDDAARMFNNDSR
jgi:hypothetical protein